MTTAEYLATPETLYPLELAFGVLRGHRFPFDSRRVPRPMVHDNRREKPVFLEPSSMTPERARAYVKQWVETGRLLEELRWRELAALDDERALAAADALLDAALRVPVPVHRREWSGLVEQQARFHHRKAA